jgi:hypothetical protein
VGRRQRELRQARTLDQPEAGDAEIHQLDLLLARIVVAEGAPVHRVKGVDEALQKRRIDRACWRRHSHFHGLSGVAQVRLAHHPHARRRDAVGEKGLGRRPFHLRIGRGDGVKIGGILVHDLGADVIGAPIHREQAEGAEVSRIERHDAGLHAEQLHHRRRLRRPGAAERE